MTGPSPGVVAEPIVEPDLPIVDPHHHLWDRGKAYAHVAADAHPFTRTLALRPRYLLPELLQDLNSGHNIRATVFVDCRAFWRAEGPEAFRPVGETEFVNGVAAMGASGQYGAVRPCAGIVSHADLLLGDGVAPVLEAHMAAGNGRFRGIRHSASFDADPDVLGPLSGRVPEGLYRRDDFRAGFRRLGLLGLTFDAWLLEPQLPDLIDLAGAFPGQPIVLDHVGTPLGIGAYRGRREERFGVWRDNIRDLAERPNVVVKLGGLAMCNPGFEVPAGEALLSVRLAALWKPYIETCIEAFGADRCMFESNFPVDLWTCDYATLWNALKRTAAGASADEKAALFSGTASRFYSLDL